MWLLGCAVHTQDTSSSRLCPALDRGHEQAVFNSLPSGLRRQRTLALLAELSLATEGGFFVGSFFIEHWPFHCVAERVGNHL